MKRPRRSAGDGGVASEHRPEQVCRDEFGEDEHRTRQQLEKNAFHERSRYAVSVIGRGMAGDQQVTAI
jgi:hypothetical protein